MQAKPLALIIEDDEFLADIFSDTLRGAGFETQAIHDGETAMQQLAIIQPALVVLDLNLPKYSGRAIFSFIQSDEKLRNTWVIVASADALMAADLRSQKHEHEKILVLVKPVSVEQLEQLARRVVFG